jgi:hypothetical protein
MGEISRALGQGSSLEFNGQTYPLAPLEYDIQAAFEIWLEGRAWAGYYRSARFLKPDDQVQLMKETARDIAGCVYSFGAEISGKALQGPPGQKYMLFLLMKKAQLPTGPDVTEKLIDEIWQSKWLEAMAHVDALINDPNSPAPAAGRESSSPASAPSSSASPSPAA